MFAKGWRVECVKEEKGSMVVDERRRVVLLELVVVELGRREGNGNGNEFWLKSRMDEAGREIVETTVFADRGIVEGWMKRVGEQHGIRLMESSEWCENNVG